MTPPMTTTTYEKHMRAINPTMTIVPVGDNAHGHPNKKALELYKKHSTGSNKGNKVFTTQNKGTMKLALKDDGLNLNVFMVKIL